MASVFASGCNGPDEKEAPLPVVSVEITETTPYSAEALVTVDANTSSYDYAIGKAADMEAFKSGTLEGIKTEGAKVENVIAFSGLEPETDYTVFVRGVNSDGSRGAVATATAKTNVQPQGVKMHIAESETTVSTISAIFTPARSVAAYHYAIGQASDLDAFAGGTMQGMVKVDDVSAPKTIIFEGLDYDTEYTIFAKGEDQYGNTGEVTSLAVATANVPQSVITIDLVERSMTSLEFSFVADENTVSYVYALGKAEDEQAFADGTLEGIKPVTDLTAPVIEKFANLEVGTKYTVFAMGTNSYGHKSEVYKMNIPTWGPPELTTEVVALDCSRVTLKYTLNESCKGGISLVLPAADYAKLGDTEMKVIENILSRATLGIALMFEEDREHTWNIRSSPEQQWVYANLIIYTNDEGNDRYQIVKGEFTTPAYNPAIPLGTVQVETVALTSTSAELRFTPDDNTIIYVHNVMEKSTYELLSSSPDYVKMMYDDLVLRGNHGYAAGTYKYNFAGAVGVKPGNTVYVIMVTYNANGVSPTMIKAHEFTLPLTD